MTEATSYLRATSVDEAIAALASQAGDAVIVAGGLVVGSLINQRLASPALLVDITRIPSLKKIEAGTDGGLTIGALTTHDDVLRSDIVKRTVPLLCEIAEDIACGRLRNRGTLGGSLCMMGQQGDPATGLLALNATIRIKGPEGSRTIPLEAFFKDAFELDLGESEILEEVHVPAAPKGAHWAFLKQGPRNAMDFTLVAVSVVARLGGDGRIDHIRCGMNGVSPTVVRPRNAEAALLGKSPGAIDWNAVGTAFDSDIKPESDLVYSASYKARLAKVLLRRAVERALAGGTK